MTNLFKDRLTHLLASDINEKSFVDKWMHLKTNLPKATEETCGISKQRKWHKQTWWWDNSVDNAVNEKRRLFKIWKKGGSKEDYTLVKKIAKQTVLAAKKKAENEKFKNIENNYVTVFRLAKQMRKENKDIIGEKCIRDNSGKLAYSDDEKIKAWKQHYERLLNVEFPWSEDDLSVADPVLGPPALVTQEMVEKSISKMKIGKAPSPSGVLTEMLKASSDVCSEMIADLTNSIISDNQSLVNGMIASLSVCVKVKVKLWIEGIIGV